MNRQATGSFEVTWQRQPPYDEGEAATLSRATVTKQFVGDLVGSGVAELTQAVTGVAGSAGYVAIERVTGSLHGRVGSFVLAHSGLMDRGAASLRVAVVPDSATGELVGLRGELSIEVAGSDHRYTFDYTFEGGAGAG